LCNIFERFFYLDYRTNKRLKRIVANSRWVKTQRYNMNRADGSLIQGCFESLPLIDFFFLKESHRLGQYFSAGLKPGARSLICAPPILLYAPKFPNLVPNQKMPVSFTALYL